jgi:hypothetical protein
MLDVDWYCNVADRPGGLEMGGGQLHNQHTTRTCTVNYVVQYTTDGLRTTEDPCQPSSSFS